MRFLIAVDLTDADAESFVERATSWVAPFSGTVDLLFVDEAADEHPYVLDPMLRSAMSTEYAAWHDQMRTRLSELLERLPTAIRGEAKVVRGLASPSILELSTDYDAIVVGNRPARGLSRLAHGVVAERIGRLSDTPVLILPRR